MSKDEYNKKCIGEYQLYDSGTSWGVTLMSTKTGDIIEVFGGGSELWDTVDELCGFREEEMQ